MSKSINTKHNVSLSTRCENVVVVVVGTDKYISLPGNSSKSIVIIIILYNDAQLKKKLLEKEGKIKCGEKTSIFYVEIVLTNIIIHVQFFFFCQTRRKEKRK